MNGIFITNNPNAICIKFGENNVYDAIKYNDIYAQRNTNNKFLNDKCFVLDKNNIYIYEGILLNKVELFNKYSVQSMQDLIYKMYKTNGDTFCNEFSGNFSGALYDDKKKKWIVFTNHQGDQQMFYAYIDGKYYFSSNINFIVKSIDKKLTIDEDGINNMLNMGCMLDNSTYVKEIKRLLAGEYLIFENNNISVNRYHMFSKNLDRFSNNSEDEIIDELDKSFRHAVQLEFEKDKEYNYKHIADLSGGLDSRMNAWVAHELGYKDFLFETFSKQGYLDEVIATDIAEHLCEDLLFRPLDDCKYLYDIEQITQKTNGLISYINGTGSKRLMDNINFSKYGLKHTGQMGDAIIGSLIKNINSVNFSSYGYVKNDDFNVNKYNIFNDDEIFVLYFRGFYACLGTHAIHTEYTYTVSPFIQKEFMQLCLDIPLKYRIKHKLYKKWILRKYQKTADFPWETTGLRINVNNMFEFLWKVKRKLINIACRLLHIELSNNMNPLQFWFNRKIEIQEFYNKYFIENFNYIKNNAMISNDLLEKINNKFANGDVYGKGMVLTILYSIRMYQNI